jgi:methyl-accepting chemotaxis protein
MKDLHRVQLLSAASCAAAFGAVLAALLGLSLVAAGSAALAALLSAAGPVVLGAAVTGPLRALGARIRRAEATCEADAPPLVAGWLGLELGSGAPDAAEADDREDPVLTAIRREIRETSHFNDHVQAIRDGQVFDPNEAREAFRQADAAASYATTVFEEIYQSVHSLGQAFEQMRTHSFEMSEQVDSAVEQSSQTRSRVTQLHQQADEIGAVTQSIADIASMTQLLALNASIEAARAGESGRGFAVVADEVKKLANQTNEAASRISEISASISTSSTDSAEAIETISGNVNSIRALVSTSVDEVDSQWTMVKGLLGKMGQTAGTVSGLQGILAASGTTLETHFAFLEGLYQFSAAAGESMRRMAAVAGEPFPEGSASGASDEGSVDAGAGGDERAVLG